MRTRKLSSICCIIIISIVLIIIVINNLKSSDSTINNENTPSPETAQKFYSLALPKGYTLKPSDEIKYEDYLYLKKEKVASIDINPDCDYSLDLSSILANWIGESAYIKNDVEKKNFGSYQRYKVFIGFEKSAAQEESNEAIPNELHYFFIKDKLLLDLSIDLDKINEKDAMLIANSIKLNLTPQNTDSGGISGEESGRDLNQK